RDALEAERNRPLVLQHDIAFRAAQAQVALERGRSGDRPLPVDEKRCGQPLVETGCGDGPLRRQALELAARYDSLPRPAELVDHQMAVAERSFEAAKLD